MTNANEFALETFVDFPDDALTAPTPIGVSHIDSLMSMLSQNGVRRVHWGYYGDGHGGYHIPAGIERLHPETPLDVDQNQWENYALTCERLGNPLRVAVEAAHRHGMEIYAYYKPYETGISAVLPEGSPEAQRWGNVSHVGGRLAWIDPFVVNNPELRIRRRTDDLPAGLETARIGKIVLTKSDAAPTRITAEHLQIWSSDRNYNYRMSDARFGFDERVVASDRDVTDIYGNLITRQGDPVRQLTLSGLDLPDRYVLVTTDFAEGTGDFANTWDRLMTVFDTNGEPMPGVYATGTQIWFPQWENFRTGGLTFDTGRGPELTTLDLPNQQSPETSKRQSSRNYYLFEKPAGFIAYARGVNEYMPGALCETEPRVQDYWLSCLGEMLDAGVDGVDFRVENHSTHTDSPNDYGFNQVVLDRIPVSSKAFKADIARVRGDAYTEFLRSASRMIRERGRRMRVNLNVAWFRAPEERIHARRLAFPGLIDFQWRRWIEEGLVDDATLRVYAKPFDSIFGEDPVAQEMISICNDRNIPVHVNRYVHGSPNLLDEYQRVIRDGRFSGFVLYEVWSYAHPDVDGRWAMAFHRQENPTDTDRHLHDLHERCVESVRSVFEVHAKRPH